MTRQSTPQWIPEVSDFAARLVLIRHHMGWNLKEAAMACGLSAQNWREWELTGRKPRDYEGVCRRIAARTDCNLIWLMTGQSVGSDPTRFNPGVAA